MRILILDDDPDVHDCLTGPDRTLSTVWEDAPWDLVVADRLDVPLRPGTPLIVVTSESTPEKIIAAIRAGAFAWFRKPFSASALREMADRALTAPRLPDAIEVVSSNCASAATSRPPPACFIS
jgi:hypothetical protein